MPVGLGAKAKMTLKEQSVWGTGVFVGARDAHMRVVRDETEVDEGTFTSDALGSRTETNVYEGERSAGGQVEPEIGFEGGLLYLLKHVCGGYDFQVGVPVASANTHVFSPKENLPAGLSIEMGMGGIIGDDKMARQIGVKISKLQLILEQNKLLRCVYEPVMQDEDTNTTLGHTEVEAFAPPALKPIKFWHYSSLSVAGTAVAGLRSGTFTIDNDLQRRYNLKRTTEEPIPGRKRKVTFEGVMEFNDLAHYNKFRLGTLGAFSLVITSDVMVTGATPFGITIVGANSRLTAGRHKITDAGIVTAPIECQLVAPTGGEFFISVVNGQATAGSEIL